MNGMRQYFAGVAAVAMLASGPLLPAVAATAATAAPAAATAPLGVERSQVADVPRSIFAARDFGRRRPLERVTATIALRYNRHAELDTLVNAQSDRRSPLYHHFLSSAQFDNYFAPTQQQQALVISTLQAAGLHVSHAFANRTLLDVVGTSAAAERFFDTEIHSFAQDRYAARFANVKPATVPANLASLVRSISLSNLIIAKARPRLIPTARLAEARRLAGAGVSPDRFAVPAFESSGVEPDTGSVIKDPGFELGGLGHGWGRCEAQHASPLASIAKTRAHSGRYSGFAGSLTTSAPEPIAAAGICQLVKIPTKGILSAYLYQLSNQKNPAQSGEDAFLIDTSGNVVAILASSANNHAGWVRTSFSVGRFAGRVLYVYFGVHGDGSRSHHTQQYVDDVTLISAGAAPSPVPTAIPTATPGPAPSPVVCNATPDTGPLSNAYGYLATGVADAFDYPVQHGCNGAGTTAAVVIDAAVIPSDVRSYLSAAGVTETGTITDVPIDGGSNTLADNDETSLDVETIAGLAPGANIRIYDLPDLSDQNIEDGYNQVVADNLASAVNSSFGGCEYQDPMFAETTDQIAEQGAAEGITFVAASGDSGSDGCGTLNDPPLPSAPAGDPHFVSVGGTNFTQSTSGTLLTLTAQGDVPYFLSGGGVSSYFALPSYQSGIPNVVPSGRNQPDVSLPGVDVAVYYGGGNIGGFDGTSWSSPCFVALLADANGLHGNSRFGFLNPTIYNAFTSAGYADFTDVAVGTNGFYQAQSGYDRVTGIGDPKGYAFSLAI